MNSDGVPDLIWQNASSGAVLVWYMGGGLANIFQGSAWLTSVVAPGWRIAAVADVNGDGVPDLIWQNATVGVVVWYMGGPQGTIYHGSAGVASPAPGWAVGSQGLITYL